MKSKLTVMIATVLLLSIFAVMGYSVLVVADQMQQAVEEHRARQLERIKEGTIYEF